MLLKLSLYSLLHRKTTVVITIASLFIGITLLLSVLFIKNQAKTNFTSTVSGIDLIIGGKTSDINLLLYSVFRLGDPTANFSWNSYEFVRDHNAVQWAIPISLGDSHKGFRVIGTSDNYYKHYRFGDERSLQLKTGQFFEGPLEVVLGSDVARELKYSVGHSIVLSHGINQNSFTHHDQVKFNVTGVLKKTNTPVDESLYVSLGSIELIHEKWPNDVSEKEKIIQEYKNKEIHPKFITAAYVGLKQKSMAFVLQRQINTYPNEPLMAILPGVALASMWRMISFVERTSMIIAILVLFSTLMGLAAILLSILHARKKELALLRMIGATPFFCFLLIQSESMLIVLSSVLISFAFLFFSLTIFSEWISHHFGMYIKPSQIVSSEIIFVVSIIFILTFLITLIPSIKYYKQSIAQNISFD